MIADENLISEEIAQTIVKTIRDVMKCCKCRGVLTPQIWNCRLGHNTCSSCRKAEAKCSICNGNLAEQLRNLELERIHQVCISVSSTFFEEGQDSEQDSGKK